ncbi:glycosyltransferase family 4 protein [Paenibacillus ihbetae]|nr:glycosyltransferase family 4 protein [Paenibacillus ihbetae]
MMKILLATHWLIPHLGGVWNFMQQLKQRLELLGHEVDLLGDSPDYQKIHIVNRGLELSKAELLPMLEAKLTPQAAPGMNQHDIIRNYELSRYCMELAAAYFGLDQYDIIHTQDIFAARSLGRVKPKKTPLIAHVHGSVSREMSDHFRNNPSLGVTEGSPAWRYFPAVEYHAAMSSDIMITANQWAKNILVHECGIPDYRVTVFQYGLDSAAFQAKYHAESTIQRPLGKKVIICPARLVHVKGIHVLLSALAILKQWRKDWVCWIAGDGAMRAELEAQTVQASLQHEVFFLGEQQNVPALLSQSDIFVHTCIHDNQPFSVMEAQMAGLPSVVSTTGGLPEMVTHGHTGLIVPVNDAASTAHHLNLLLTHDDYRLYLGQNARSFAQQHWSMDQMIDRILNIYYSALAQKSS